MFVYWNSRHYIRGYEMQRPVRVSSDTDEPGRTRWSDRARCQLRSVDLHECAGTEDRTDDLDAVPDVDATGHVQLVRHHLVDPVRGAAGLDQHERTDVRAGRAELHLQPALLRQL